MTNTHTPEKSCSEVKDQAKKLLEGIPLASGISPSREVLGLINDLLEYQTELENQYQQLSRAYEDLEKSKKVS